jgi:catechol 2,3-dioxygenase-like lactoylglutathione lyase family enzyme
MELEVTGLDHVYLAVSNFDESERFYDGVMKALGFKKGDSAIGGERHAHYFNRYLQVSIRPARTLTKHDCYAPGLHHLCLRLPDPASIDAAARELSALGVRVTEPRLYPEYADDYYATFFEDPDGVRLELVALRQRRRDVVEKWEQLRDFLNPFERLREREEGKLE